MTMTVQMHIPSQDMKLLQELAAKMGWDISADGLDSKTASDDTAVDRLYGSITLPKDFDYKQELEKSLRNKYL